MNQGVSPQKFYGRHIESVDKYGVSISTGTPGSLLPFLKESELLIYF
jgi:hypothetical protein